jgi:hypothetical protein
LPDTHHPYTLILAAALRGAPLQLGSFGETGVTRLLDTAARHGISQLINQKIRGQQIQGLAGEGKTQLAERSNIGVVRDMLLNESTQKTLELLAGNHLPALLLKGTAIACKYYDETYLRTRCDTDLFIRVQDKQQIAELLSANGYAISGFDSRKYASKQFLALHNPDSAIGTTFDIHWKLSNRTLFYNALQFDECWKDRQAVKQLGKDAFTLSAEHLLIHACIHRIAHGRNSERNRLLWLYDIHLITNTFSAGEFNRFLKMAKAKGIGTLCADGLIMSQYYFGSHYPQGYLSELSDQKSKETTAKLIDASKLRWALADVQALKGAGAKLGLLKELLFPAYLKNENRHKSNNRGLLHHLRAKLIT